uniref:ABC transporter domain-containing protein n=1 Tax=Schistocephalus solidus TaxID=70667 RepID=A0A183SG01_SCHSO
LVLIAQPCCPFFPDSMTCCCKLYILCLKNLLILRRRWFSSLLIVLLPALICLSLLAVRAKTPRSRNQNNTTWSVFSVAAFPPTPRGWHVVYTPPCQFADKVMNHVASSHNLSVEAFPTESALVEFLSRPQTQKTSYAGVIFHSCQGDFHGKPVVYSIRMHSIGSWETRLLYPRFPLLGPRSREDPTAGPPEYLDSGFLAVQATVDIAIIEVFSAQWGSGSSTGNAASPFPPLASLYKFKRMPYPAHLEDVFSLVVEQQLALMVVMGFLFPAVYLIRRILEEKCSRVKVRETMHMLGASSMTYWVSWFVTFAFMFAVSSAILTAALCVDFGVGGRMLNLSDPSIIFCSIFLYSLGLLAFIMALSTLFSSPHAGAAVTCAILMLTFSPYQFINIHYERYALLTKVAFCLLPNMAIGFLSYLIGHFEGVGAGLHWSSLSKQVSSDDMLRVDMIWIVLFVDIIVYGFAAWYVDNVFPGKYGISKPWYFPLRVILRYRPGVPVSADGVTDRLVDPLRDSTHLKPQLSPQPCPTADGGMHSISFEEPPIGLSAGISIHTLSKASRCAPATPPPRSYNNALSGPPALTNVTMGIYEGQITVLLGHNGAGKTTLMSILTGLLPPTTGTAYIGGFNILTDVESVRQTIGYCPQHDLFLDDLTVAEHLRLFARVSYDSLRSVLRDIFSLHMTLLADIKLTCYAIFPVLKSTPKFPSYHFYTFLSLFQLKGCPKSELDAQVAATLSKVRLKGKRNRRAWTLSGGTKRRLSLGLALIANSKEFCSFLLLQVLILDEPTSGLDPAARRQIWDILQRERPFRTILVTTHYMDEAEYLGDRIAILSGGKLRCLGSPLFLKSIYGTGYCLTLMLLPVSSVEDVVAFIKQHIFQAVVQSHDGNELKILLPLESVPGFPNLLGLLEKKALSLGIASFGLSVTTMEDVFLRVSDIGPSTVTLISKDNNLSLPPNRLRGSFPSTSPGPLIDLDPIEVRSATGIALYCSQLFALLGKRFTYSKRHPLLTFSQLLIPCICTLVAHLLYREFANNASDALPALALSLKPFGTGLVVTTATASSPDARTLVTAYESQFVPSQITTRRLASPSMFELGVKTESRRPEVEEGAGGWRGLSRPLSVLLHLARIQRSWTGQVDEGVLNASMTSLHKYITQYIVGLVVQQSTDAIETIGYFMGESLHALPVAVNALSNALLRKTANDSSQNPDLYRIETFNHPLPITAPTELFGIIKAPETWVNILISGISLSVNSLAGVSFLVASLVFCLISERSCNAKHLQFISGARLGTYWFAMLAWDAVTYTISGLCVFLVFLLFNIPPFARGSRLWLSGLLLTAFGWAVIPEMYLLSVLFSTPTSGLVWLSALNVFSGIIGMLIVESLCLPMIHQQMLALYIRKVLIALSPPYAFADAVFSVHANFEYTRLCAAPEVQEFCPLLPQLPCCLQTCDPFCAYYTDNVFDFTAAGIGENLVAMVVQGFLFGFFVLFTDTVVARRLWIALKSCILFGFFRSSFTTRPSQYLAAQADDEDVLFHRQEVESSSTDSLRKDSSIALVSVSKRYDINCRGLHPSLAVNNCSLSIKPAECFGLLGVNGAGKTTLFRMVTGQLDPTCGKIFVNGYDILKQQRLAQHSIGYCPQFDALPDYLTVNETLLLFGRLRGLQGTDHLAVAVDDLLRSLQLIDAAGVLVCHLSGGKRRRLSVAVALIGSPRLLCLDEPTAGLDPVSRRRMWNVLLQRRQAGTTLLLSSHSMEECEALCTRLGVMVNGRLKCLGTCQHLKSRFGQGYSLCLQVSLPPAVWPTNVTSLVTATTTGANGVGSRTCLSCASSTSNLTVCIASSGDAVSCCSTSTLGPGVTTVDSGSVALRASVQRVIDFLTTELTHIQLLDRHQGVLQFHLMDPSAGSVNITPSTAAFLSRIFGLLECYKAELGINAYYISQTTLEQVFVNLVRLQKEPDDIVPIGVLAIIAPQHRPDILAAVSLAFNDSLAGGNLVFETVTAKIHDTSPVDSGLDVVDLINRICQDTSISDATRPDVILPLGLTIFTTCALGELSMNLDAGVMSTTKFACSPLDLQTMGTELGGDGGETSINVPSVRISDSAITAAMAEFSHLLLGALHESIVFIDELIVSMDDQTLATTLTDLLTKTEANAWFLATNTTNARRVLRLFPHSRLTSGRFCPIGVPCNWLLFDATEEMRDCVEVVSTTLQSYLDAELSAVQFFCISRAWNRTSPKLLGRIIQAVGASWSNMTEDEHLQTIFSYEATFSAAQVLQNLIFRNEWNTSRSKEPCSVENPSRNETSYMYKFAEEVRRLPTRKGAITEIDFAYTYFSDSVEFILHACPKESIQLGKGCDNQLAIYAFPSGNTSVVGNLKPFLPNGRRIRVTLFEEPPFVIYENGTYIGFLMELLDTLAERLNFSYILLPLSKPEYGVELPNGTWTGRADIALVPMSITSDRARVVDFTFPYFDVVGLIMVQRDHSSETGSMFFFMTVFSKWVWLSSVVSVIVIGCMLTLLDRLSPYSFQNTRAVQAGEPAGLVFDLQEALWFVIGSAMQLGQNVNPRAPSTRILLAGFWLFVTIMLAMFSANLSAFLTVAGFDARASNLWQLSQDAGIKFTVQKGTPGETYFARLGASEQALFQQWKQLTLHEDRTSSTYCVWQYPIHEVYSELFRSMLNAGLTSSTDESLQRLQEDWMVFMETPLVQYYTNKYCNFETVGDQLGSWTYGLVLQKGFPLKYALDSVILDLQTEQVLEMLKQKWLSYGAVQCPPPTKDPGFRPDQIAGVFIVLCVGYVLSLIALLVEFLTAWLLRKYAFRLHPNARHIEELCQEKVPNIQLPEKTVSEKILEVDPQNNKFKFRYLSIDDALKAVVGGNFTRFLSLPQLSLTTLSVGGSLLTRFLKNAPELYFLRIESSFNSANITSEVTKFHRLVQALPLQGQFQGQAVIQSPPVEQACTQLKGALLRLHTVPDGQRYHQLIREECMGDRKPTELLRRMQTLCCELHTDDKLFKEIFLERLPTDVQTISASGSEDFSVSRLAEMADRILEVQRFQPPSSAQLSTSPYRRLVRTL